MQVRILLPIGLGFSRHLHSTDRREIHSGASPSAFLSLGSFSLLNVNSYRSVGLSSCSFLLVIDLLYFFLYFYIIPRANRVSVPSQHDGRGLSSALCPLWLVRCRFSPVVSGWLVVGRRPSQKQVFFGRPPTLVCMILFGGGLPMQLACLLALDWVLDLLRLGDEKQAASWGERKG